LTVVSGALLAAASASFGQAINATLAGRITDSSGGSVAKATLTVVNTATGVSRTVTSSDTGDYYIPALPAGTYKISAEFTGFGKQTREVILQVGQAAELDFALSPGQVEQKVEVEITAELAEPTRTQVSSVITEHQIVNLPVNGREFIDFALLSPAVSIGNTTSGSTDVIVEPVTKLSFAGQNIHYNFIAVDGADDISTASGIQRGTPPQESVQEFRVINSDYSAEFGRATAGIVNIITRSGTNDWHGILYEYFRNNKMDAINLLQANGAHVLRQNQFGGAIGGPIQKDKTFIYANYELQRRAESHFYNSFILGKTPSGARVIDLINKVKTAAYGLPPEPDLASVLGTNDTDNAFIRLDRRINDKHSVYLRYFINDGRLLKQSPLSDGFDLPSTFRNNFYRDQSLAGSLASVINPNLVNELRMQFARRSFNFPSVSSQPHLELLNVFTTGVNRGNPEFYRESRYELVDNLTRTLGKHTVTLGGNYNWVRTQESFPLFYPFEAHFSTFASFLGTDGGAGTPACAAVVGTETVVPGCQDPGVIFFQRFDATTTPPFTEPSINPTAFSGTSIPAAVRNQAQGTLDHSYDGLFIQDKWRATNRLTLNAGIRWEWETWPSAVLNTQWKNFDPRLGMAYNVGTKHNVVIRAGFGLFHGIIPAPLLACQRAVCGGTQGKYPGRPFEDSWNAVTRAFAFGGAPNLTAPALQALASTGTYPANSLDVVAVRFVQDHKNPYGVQASLAVEFDPLPDTTVSISGLHIRGVHLGSFFNVNQPDPNTSIPVGLRTFHDSQGRSGLKDLYCAFVPNVPCPFTPQIRNFPFAIFFEATSRWDSQYDGLLININKRLSHNFAYGISYTWAKSIDDGPNPSFVLIPQDSGNFRGERAVSSDDVRNRLVLNGTVSTPASWGPIGRDFLFGLIATIQSPMRFTKYAGLDANGDIFDNNDRVGIEPRNTFIGDNYRSVDVRISRKFAFQERRSLELIAEAFNLSNTLNIRYFNTVYDATDFCPFNSTAFGCQGGPFLTHREGSPNLLYGAPRAVNNPRQIQLAVKFNF
jgi:outer membrane receptor protein involved in Fe transport